MLSLKLILSLLLGLYLFTLALAFFNSRATFRSNQESAEYDYEPLFLAIQEPSASFFDRASIFSVNKKAYKFVNPSLAYKVLSELDVFKPVDAKYFIGRAARPAYHLTFLGTTNEDNYCDKNRAYVTENAESLFVEKNFMLEWTHNSLIRTKVTTPIGNDVMPKVHPWMTQEQKTTPTYDLKPSITSYFSSNSIYDYKHVGQHFSCLAQESNQIPGAQVIARKDFVAEAAKKYVDSFEGRSQCLSNDKYFPKTWLLYEKADCEAFFQQFNSVEYQKLKEERTIVYIRKLGIGAHRGTGVQPVNDQEESELRTAYGNGSLCGQVTKNYIIQHYVHNPLLLNGNKFDFRMYLLVASTNPMIAYYHDGFLRVSLAKYDASSNDKKVLLTNLALNDEIYNDLKKGALFNGLDEEALRIAQQWSFERLQTYLLQAGIISDPNWLDNYLRPELKKAMIHLMRLAKSSLLENSSVYGLYGVDYMLDDQLNVWFIEANSGPAFDGYSAPMEKFIVKMLQDHFEVVHALMKSRMKRVINHVNMIIENDEVRVSQDGETVIEDLEGNRALFNKLSKNMMEKEFEPSADNGFSKIIDENLSGVDMYQGFIKQECL